jgi:hypothetical protein
MHLKQFRNPSSGLLGKSRSIVRARKKEGEPKLKNAPDSKKYKVFLAIILLFCITFLAGCGDDTGATSSQTTATTPTAAITPVGAQPVCLTVNSPSLVKLADGTYNLQDEIDNCGNNDAGPLKVTLQISNQTLNLLGPVTLAAKGKTTYNAFSNQAGGTGNKIHLTSQASSSVTVTILATINNNVQGEWDGEVKLPA